MEVVTYRYREHVGPGDDFPAGYRDIAELKQWQAKDPLIQRPELVAKFEAEIKKEIDQAVKFAEESPWPTRDELLTHVY